MRRAISGVSGLVMVLTGCLASEDGAGVESGGELPRMQEGTTPSSAESLGDAIVGGALDPLEVKRQLATEFSASELPQIALVPEDLRASFSKISNPFSAYYSKYLGDGRATPIRRTRVHGIQYYDNGFSPHTDAERAAMLAKISESVSFLNSKGVRPGTVTDFEDYAKRIAVNPHELGDQIDFAYETRSFRWNKCGGRFARAISSLRKRDIVVTVQPGPFYVCNTNAPGGCAYAGGAVMPNRRDIMASVIYVQRVQSAPAEASLVRFGSFVRWELGNYAAKVALGFTPKTLDQEFGDKSPCGGPADVPPVPVPPPPPVDKTPPSITFESPRPYGTVRGNVTVRASASDNVASRKCGFRSTANSSRSLQTHRT